MDTLEKIDVLDAKVKTAVRLIVSLREEKISLLDRLEEISEEKDSLFEEKEQFASIRETLEAEKEKASILCQELELKNKDLEIQVSTFRDRVEDLEKQSSNIVDDNSLIESGIQDAINRLNDIEKEVEAILAPKETSSPETVVDSSIQKEAESSFDGSILAESSIEVDQESVAISVEPEVTEPVVAIAEELVEEELVEDLLAKEVEPNAAEQVERAPLGEPSVDVAIEEIASDDSPRELFDSTDDASVSEPDRARDLFQSQDDEFDDEPDEEVEKDFFSQDSTLGNSETETGESVNTNSVFSEESAENNQIAAKEASVDVPIESIEPSPSDSLEIF